MGVLMAIKYEMRLSPIISHSNRIPGNLDSPPVTINQWLIKTVFCNGTGVQAYRNTE